MSKSRRIHSLLQLMAHWLDRLLNPQTIAIVGASERVDSLAATTHRQLTANGYAGEIYSVNPRYQSLHGQACYASLIDLPVVPDLVVYAISGIAVNHAHHWDANYSRTVAHRQIEPVGTGPTEEIVPLVLAQLLPELALDLHDPAIPFNPYDTS